MYELLRHGQGFLCPLLLGAHMHMDQALQRTSRYVEYIIYYIWAHTCAKIKFIRVQKSNSEARAEPYIWYTHTAAYSFVSPGPLQERSKHVNCDVTADAE